ncbi:hypothetical protein PRIPAC_70920, partial [Pristionchus pacificus]|uniref:Uncharacterized protein n=1 Tax=Pristionchus pacificus TaxID=54126 RepID=A0A2A6BGQ9_PRIPA
ATMAVDGEATVETEEEMEEKKDIIITITIIVVKREEEEEEEEEDRMEDGVKMEDGLVDNRDLDGVDSSVNSLDNSLSTHSSPSISFKRDVSVNRKIMNLFFNLSVGSNSNCEERTKEHTNDQRNRLIERIREE